MARTTANVIYKSELTEDELIQVLLTGKMPPIKPILRGRRGVILGRIGSADEALRGAFAELETLEYTPTFGNCIRIVTIALA